MKPSAVETVNTAGRVIDIEIKALSELKNYIGVEFERIVQAVASCNGKVILCGIGKSGHVARKISATLSSLGTQSFFLHPSEAQHGDMGMVGSEDVVILVSHSGETQEILAVLPAIKIIGAMMVAITSGFDSTLARECDIVQIMPDVEEACYLKLAPTSSTTCVMAYGDAVAVAVSELHGFTREDFGLFHPAGTLGKRLLIRVRDIMASGDAAPIVKSGCLMTDAVLEMSRKTLGMLLITDESGYLVGLLTDGDLRRAIEKRMDMYYGVVDDAMTHSPKAITEDVLAVNALQELKKYHFNNFPVVDSERRVIGAITWQMIVREGIV